MIVALPGPIIKMEAFSFPIIIAAGQWSGLGEIAKHVLAVYWREPEKFRKKARKFTKKEELNFHRA